MKRNSLYILKELNEIPYLLPFGQNLSSFRKSIRLNSTGVFLWNLLEQEITMEEIMEKAAVHFHASPEELPELKGDLEHFLSTLNAYGILEHDEIYPDFWEEHLHLNIAGLHLSLQGSSGDFSPEFLPFSEEFVGDADMTIRVLHYAPSTLINGHMLIRDPELMVMDCDNLYVITFPTSPYIIEARLAKDASYASFYCEKEHSQNSVEQLFHGIRLMFLYLAQKHHMAVIHSASLLYKGKAWLFSGSSGTGKSTHTNLWHTLEKVPLINGDLNLLAIENDTAVIHGLPWCGTSKISDTNTYPLGGIVLLRKSPTNYMEPLAFDNQILSIHQRFISPAWDDKQLLSNLAVAENIAKKVHITKLHCTKDEEAVKTMKAEIDDYLS